MKNATIAKKMYYCALNYFDACEKLRHNLLNDNNPSIIYPLMYLERHTLELLLKSIILFSVKKQNIIEDLKVIINDGSAFDLSRTHSLLILINKYIEINANNFLFPNFDEKVIKDIRKQLEIWDKFDSDSLVNINFKNIYIMVDQNNEVLHILKNVDLQSLKYINILYDNCLYFLEQLSNMVK